MRAPPHNAYPNFEGEPFNIDKSFRAAPRGTTVKGMHPSHYVANISSLDVENVGPPVTSGAVTIVKD